MSRSKREITQSIRQSAQTIEHATRSALDDIDRCDDVIMRDQIRDQLAEILLQLTDIERYANEADDSLGQIIDRRTANRDTVTN